LWRRARGIGLRSNWRCCRAGLGSNSIEGTIRRGEDGLSWIAGGHGEFDPTSAAFGRLFLFERRMQIIPCVIDLFHGDVMFAEVNRTDPLAAYEALG
jgi:hypothetical protein